ncbi:short chain dehydrogenase domain protein [Campylobacter jejuni subsp. jejuni DFVF1099]|nr:short chain dehydrogenase domain protein [Campylobacter jejuni subsp. jejuni DFVF1099]
MDLKIKNKVCIITGGAKGIGYGIAKLWASEGGIPVIFSRSMPKEHDKELKNYLVSMNFMKLI